MVPESNLMPAGSSLKIPANVSWSDESRDQLARNHLRQLLKNIEIMLTYATDNGIALPDDLRPKIAKLLSYTDGRDDLAPPSPEILRADSGDDLAPPSPDLRTADQ
jgi:hypothetical protein